MLAAAHAEFPDDATVLYNLACAESMSGRTAEGSSVCDVGASGERFPSAPAPPRTSTRSGDELVLAEALSPGRGPSSATAT